MAETLNLIRLNRAARMRMEASRKKVRQIEIHHTRQGRNSQINSFTKPLRSGIVKSKSIRHLRKCTPHRTKLTWADADDLVVLKMQKVVKPNSSSSATSLYEATPIYFEKRSSEMLKDGVTFVQANVSDHQKPLKSVLKKRRSDTSYETDIQQLKTTSSTLPTSLEEKSISEVIEASEILFPVNEIKEKTDIPKERGFSSYVKFAEDRLLSAASSTNSQTITSEAFENFSVPFLEQLRSTTESKSSLDDSRSLIEEMKNEDKLDFVSLKKIKRQASTWTFKPEVGKNPISKTKIKRTLNTSTLVKPEENMAIIKNSLEHENTLKDIQRLEEVAKLKREELAYTRWLIKKSLDEELENNRKLEKILKKIKAIRIAGEKGAFLSPHKSPSGESI